MARRKGGWLDQIGAQRRHYNSNWKPDGAFGRGGWLAFGGRSATSCVQTSLARKIKIRAAHEIMAARAAQLALFVDQLMAALRTPAPVLAGNVVVGRRGAGVVQRFTFSPRVTVGSSHNQLCLFFCQP